MSEKEKKKPPKGGRKGGAFYPKIDLKKAVEYNKKLVSKTHTSPQPASVIHPGVFNTNGTEGVVRASALRQFGLLNDDKTKMEALELGKNIASSPPDELSPLLQDACLKPKVFKQLFETFKGDSVTVPKLRQQAVKLKVHPDSADDCVTIFISSLQYCGLARADGDGYFLNSVVNVTSKVEEPSLENPEEAVEEQDPEMDLQDKKGDNKNKTQVIKRNPSSPVQVTLNLDSTMDSDKLEKFLKLLKTYGAI